MENENVVISGEQYKEYIKLKYKEEMRNELESMKIAFDEEKQKLQKQFDEEVNQIKMN